MIKNTSHNLLLFSVLAVFCPTVKLLPNLIVRLWFDILYVSFFLLLSRKNHWKQSACFVFFCFSFAFVDLFSCRLSSTFYFLLQNDLCQNLGIPIDISSAGTINVRISPCFRKSFQFHAFSIQFLNYILNLLNAKKRKKKKSG